MIKGKRIILKSLEKKHLDKLRVLRNDRETNYYLTSVIPINEEMQEDWFKRISLDPTKIYMAIEGMKGEFIGLVRNDEWDKINRSIRIGIDIAPEYRRQGYASEAYDLLFEFYFNNLGINRIWLLVVVYNKAAISLYEKLGFKIEGKQRQAIYRNNKFNDYIMMSILKNEYEKK